MRGDVDMAKTVCVCLSATIQKTIVFSRLEKDAVNRSDGYRLDASGKAVNAARVMCQLSPGSAVAVVPLGEDNAETFLALAAADSVPISWVPVPGRTRYCYTLLECGALRGALRGANRSVTELVVGEPGESADYGAIAESLLDLVRAEARDADALLLAGSRPPFWPNDLCLRIVREAHAAGVAVMADFHGADLSLVLDESIPEIVKINEDEFRATFGMPPTRDATGQCRDFALEAEIARRSTELGNAIVVTRGARETIAAYRGEVIREGIDAIDAVNTIGCGDSFAAGFLHAWIATRGDLAKSLGSGRHCATANALSLRPGSILDPSAPGEGLL